MSELLAMLTMLTMFTMLTPHRRVACMDGNG